jgi:hypothetical protein
MRAVARCLVVANVGNGLRRKGRKGKVGSAILR